jgi:undecaprenyl-diphosphatase
VGLLALATLPVGVVGVLWGDALEAAFQSPRLVGVALLFTGTLLLSSRWALRRPLERQINARIALWVGLAQCVALLPGVSRSGMTVVTALWLGVAPVQAAAFSFLLSIPTIGGAAVLSLPDLQAGTLGVGALPLAVAATAAAVTGVLAIRAFVRLLRNRAFPIFALYCWGVGLLFLGWLSLSGA